GEDADLPPVDEDGVALGHDLRAEVPVNRVVLEQMRQGRRVGEVVDRHDLDPRGAPRRAVEDAADPTEAIDPHLERHRSPSCRTQPWPSGTSRIIDDYRARVSEGQ